MKLTKLADYAVRAVVHLATKKDGEVATIAEIAKNQIIPISFLAKVMQALSRGGIARGTRGKLGGFYLIDQPKDITVRMIIEAVEGPIILNRCLRKSNECDRVSFCGTHSLWLKAQSTLYAVLDECTAAEMAKEQTFKISRAALN